MTDQHAGGRLEGTILALDVDGVLLDPERGGQGPWQEVLHERYGVDPTLLDREFFAVHWARVVVGRVPIESALSQVLGDLGWAMGVEAVLRCWFDADFVIDDDVVDAVNQWAAAGARPVLVTNQEARRADFLGRNLRARMPIEGMCFSGGLGVVKREPAFYPAAEEQLGIRPGERVVLVDDTLENIVAATASGWIGVHFRRDHDWQRAVGTALRGAGSRT